VPFLYDGINGHTGVKANMDSVASQRGTPGTDWATFDHRLFPAPAFAVLVEPTRGAEEGHKVLEALMSSDYIDKQTRAIFIDMALFNPMVQHVSWMRFSVEITEAGSLIARHDFSVLHLWDRLHPEGLDRCSTAHTMHHTQRTHYTPYTHHTLLATTGRWR
jgi:hypothetical protein